MLWRRQLSAMIRLFAVQGLALAALVAILGLHQRSAELVVVAVGLGVLRGRRAAVPGPPGARRCPGRAARDQPGR